MAAEPNRILVTGATGLVGSHSVRALLDAGYRVRAFVRSPEKAQRVFGAPRIGLELARGDIQDEASVFEAMRGCDGVIHCAALVAIGSANSPEGLVETNVSGVRNDALNAKVTRAVREVYTENVQAYTALVSSQPIAVFVTGFVKNAEQRSRKIMVIISRYDAAIVRAKAGTKRMSRDVQSAPREVKTDLGCHRFAKCLLCVDRIIASKNLNGCYTTTVGNGGNERH